MRRFLLLSLSIATATAATRVTPAADINWNSTIGSQNYTSAGSMSVMGEGFTFELGAFLDSFVPDAGNVSQWAEKWVALDRDQYNPVSKFFTSKGSVTSNAQPFHPATRPYIWGFNQESPGEWILLTNPNWFWPFAGGGPQPPLTWSIRATGTVAVVGAVNGSGFQMMTAQVSEEPPDVNPDAWLQQHFSAAERVDTSISGWDADPDGDGADNLYELGGGTDPQLASDSPQHEIEVVDTGSGELALECRLTRSQRAAITYSAESSTDLDKWDPAGLVVVSDSPAQLVLRFPAPGARHFVRLVLSP